MRRLGFQSDIGSVSRDTDGKTHVNTTEYGERQFLTDFDKRLFTEPGADLAMLALNQCDFSLVMMQRLIGRCLAGRCVCVCARPEL